MIQNKQTIHGPIYMMGIQELKHFLNHLFHRMVHLITQSQSQSGKKLTRFDLLIKWTHINQEERTRDLEHDYASTK